MPEPPNFAWDLVSSIHMPEKKLGSIREQKVILDHPSLSGLLLHLYRRLSGRILHLCLGLPLHFHSPKTPSRSSSSVSRPPRIQEDAAGLDILGVTWERAVVAKNASWDCLYLFIVPKPRQDHPPLCPVLQGLSLIHI